MYANWSSASDLKVTNKMVYSRRRGRVEVREEGREDGREEGIGNYHFVGQS